jgi:hypothetical protein
MVVERRRLFWPRQQRLQPNHHLLDLGARRMSPASTDLA